MIGIPRSPNGFYGTWENLTTEQYYSSPRYPSVRSRYSFFSGTSGFFLSLSKLSSNVFIERSRFESACELLAVVSELPWFHLGLEAAI